jgi:hypothetical protein
MKQQEFNPIIIYYNEAAEYYYRINGNKKLELLNVAFDYLSNIFKNVDKVALSKTIMGYTSELIRNANTSNLNDNIERLAELYNVDLKKLSRLEYEYNKIQGIELNTSATDIVIPNFNIYTTNSRQNTEIGTLVNLISDIEKTGYYFNPYYIIKAFGNKLILINNNLQVNPHYITSIV